jgi:hypothetical protein
MFMKNYSSLICNDENLELLRSNIQEDYINEYNGSEYIRITAFILIR